MPEVVLTARKLLIVTGAWAAPFTIYYLILSGRIVSERIKSKQYIGNRIPSSQTPDTSLDDRPQPDALEIATRCHANFAENVPLSFIFLIIAELNGGNRKWLNCAMALLLVFRVAHADGGLRLTGNFAGAGVGRPVGYFGTNGILLGLSGYAAWLVKGYWGI